MCVDPVDRVWCAHTTMTTTDDGKWFLEAVHPDVEGGVTKYYDRLNPLPVSLERRREPSKMITLKAMTVLHRVENLR